jgi:hypothetical protein
MKKWLYNNKFDSLNFVLIHGNPLIAKTDTLNYQNIMVQKIISENYNELAI